MTTSSKKAGHVWSDDEFYEELMKFLAGQPNEIDPDPRPLVARIIKAITARTLVRRDPTLLNPDKKAELLNKIDVALENAGKPGCGDSE